MRLDSPAQLFAWASLQFDSPHLRQQTVYWPSWKLSRRAWAHALKVRRVSKAKSTLMTKMIRERWRKSSLICRIGSVTIDAMKTLGLLAVVTLATACSTGLHLRDFENVHVGMPRQAVIDRLGEPQSRNVQEDGKEVLKYSPADSAARWVVIKDGAVEKFGRSENVVKHVSIHDYCVKHASEYKNYDECYAEVKDERKEKAADRREVMKALASEPPPGFAAPAPTMHPAPIIQQPVTPATVTTHCHKVPGAIGNDTVCETN
jgi:hypothetical protein